MGPSRTRVGGSPPPSAGPGPHRGDEVKITTRMVDGRTPARPRLSAPHRRGAAAASALPLVLLVVAGCALAAPDPVPWWTDVLGAASGLLGAYLAGRAGYAAPGTVELLARELNRAEKRELDYARIVAATALRDVPAPGGSGAAGPGPAEREPRPSAGLGGGGRPGLRAVGGGPTAGLAVELPDENGGDE